MSTFVVEVDERTFFRCGFDTMDAELRPREVRAGVRDGPRKVIC